MAFFCFCVAPSFAQDTIYKNNGTVIYAKILEMGTNAVSYKKQNYLDGPTYVDNKTDISEIKFSNGERVEFLQVAVPADKEKANADNSGLDKNGNKKLPEQPAVKSPMQNGPVAEGRRIEELNGRYTINGEKIGKRALDRELAKSKDPKIQAALKSAKAFKISQKVIGLSSYATTMGGGVVSIAAISQLVTAYQTGQLGPKYYVNAGTSLLGTLAFPITSSYLKKMRDKMYDKTIDLYNMSNGYK